MKVDNYKKSGFTLVELSIVLVIIGLLIGGVLVGQSMIETAKLNRLYAEFTNYKIAADQFEVKYNCFPGDCSKATRLGIGVSGNGDRILDNAEGVYFWQHLVNSQTLNVKYRGNLTRNMVETKLFPIVTFPAGAVISVFGGALAVQYDFGLKLCSPEANGTAATGCLGYDLGPFNAIDLIKIDSKFDDGLPLTGDIKINTQGAWKHSNCRTGATNAYNPNAADYSDDPATCTWNCPNTSCRMAPYFKIRD